MRPSFSPLLLLLATVAVLSARTEPAVLQGESGFWIQGEGIEAFVTAQDRIRLLAIKVPGGENLLAASDSDVSGLRTWIMAPNDNPDLRDEVASLSGSLQRLDDFSVSVLSEKSPTLGLVLKWRIRVDPAEPRLTIHQTLINEGDETVRLGIWSLLAFGKGNRLLLPLEGADGLEGGPRNIFYFPYARFEDPRLLIRPNYLQVSLLPSDWDKSLKLGTFHTSATGAALIGDTVLVSSALPVRKGMYPEGGPNLTIWTAPANKDSLLGELEHMDILTDLPPGQSVSLDQRIVLEQIDSSPFLKRIGFRAP